MDIDPTHRRGTFTASGPLSPHEAAEVAASALSAASAQRLATLLVDFSGLRVPRALSLTECYQLGERLARVGAGLRKVAFVTPAHCADQHAFLFTVTANRGLHTAAFSREADALRWLEG